jgi:hypothetical protein
MLNLVVCKVIIGPYRVNVLALETTRFNYYRMERIHHADETGEDIWMSIIENYKHKAKSWRTKEEKTNGRL